MEKESILFTLEKIQIMMHNAIGHLTICNFINYPGQFDGLAHYTTEIDKVILFHILDHSPHFRQYQYFSWKLYIIEMSKILGGGTDKFSLKKLKNKIENKLFIEEIDFSDQLEILNSFFEKYDSIITDILTLRSSQYAHSDFKNNHNNLNFKENWQLLDLIKDIFDSFSAPLNSHYIFPNQSEFLGNLLEIEAYYKSVVNFSDPVSKMYLMSIVDNNYLKSKNMI